MYRMQTTTQYNAGKNKIKYHTVIVTNRQQTEEPSTQFKFVE